MHRNKAFTCAPITVAKQDTSFIHCGHCANTVHESFLLHFQKNLWVEPLLDPIGTVKRKIIHWSISVDLASKCYSQ